VSSSPHDPSAEVLSVSPGPDTGGEAPPPADTRKPMPRDHRGWRVTPAGIDEAINLANEAALLAARRNHHTVSYTREDLLGKIKVALAGRVAEETVFGTITTGAESDIDQVTAIARQMVGRWGMSDAIGFVRVLPSDGRGPFPGSSGETSESTQRVLDEEVRSLIDAAHRDVTALLAEHRDRLETLSRALLKDETLDELYAYAAAQMPVRNPDAPALNPHFSSPATPTRIEGEIWTTTRSNRWSPDCRARTHPAVSSSSERRSSPTVATSRR
jgi:hypothetical protein